MRIIAGSAKGLRLAAVPEGTRPVSDRAREGLFSSLGADVVDARVLDLFAGTGALGIEALSRGAEHATFVDRNRQATRAIRSNLEKARMTDRAAVVEGDARAFLERQTGPIADIAFLDPPYDAPAQQIEQVLDLLGENRLSPAWTVVLTRPARSSNLVIPVHFGLARRLRYGDSLVLVYREV